MALFTALHRLLGRSAGQLSDDMLAEAIQFGVSETDDLDWKKQLPPAGGLSKTDFPKDVAAMANSGGGVIVFGVAESQKSAVERVDVGTLSENHERALRRAAYNAITPPVFGLEIHRLGEEGQRAVVVVVPPSVDGPHLIYRDEMFGAPIRNDADTEWMKERQIDAMYRERHHEQQRSHEALADLYKAAATGRRIHERAWIIGAARPRTPVVAQSRITQAEAAAVFRSIEPTGTPYLHRDGQQWLRPNDGLEVGRQPRPGLRSWVAPPQDYRTGGFGETRATLHDDGSVTLATAVGGYRRSHTEDAAGNECRTEYLETFTADLMALIKLASALRGTNDYDLIVGVEWQGEGELVFEQKTNDYIHDVLTGLPIAKFSPLTTTISPSTDDEGYLSQVHDLATDLVNQAGLQYVRLLNDADSQPRG